MNTKTSLNNFRIGIIGLGLMGGSLALALRGHCAALFGVDTHSETLAFAINHKIIDWGEHSLSQSLNAQDIIILAVPVKAILEIIQILPGLITKETLIMDIGSTKRRIIEAYNRLPGHLSSIGGHPMCGKAVGGIASAEGSLFQNAQFALIKSNQTTSGAVQIAEDLVQIIGAIPFWLDAKSHDKMTAGTSHLPYLTSCALVQSTPKSFAKLAGPGFGSASRLAASPITMMGDILETNKDEMLISLDRFLSALQTYRNLLAEGNFQQLRDLLSKAHQKRHAMLQKNEGSAAR